MSKQPGLITITSQDSAASARIRADVGFNCFSFTAPVGDRTIEALWSEPAFAEGKGRPSRSGNPVLFPFAGRIRDGAFEWRGQTYQITTAGKSDRHAIHGFVYTRPWRVIAQSADSATGVFQGSVDAPETVAEWPSDYAIEITWRVAGNRLEADVVISNPGDSTLPFVFGLHPYFRVPLGGSSADDCLITVPAATYRELDDLLPTGRDLPVDQARDMREPRRFGDLDLDDVVTDLTSDETGTIETIVADPESGVRLVQTFSNENPFVVVFNPPHREAIAIEPYTGGPNPFASEALGLDAGLTLLEPGESWRAHYCIALES